MIEKNTEIKDNALRELQLFELQMLKDIKKVCEEHNIRYFIYAGTCLGAVRHKGFIPWDDDIDIAMTVPEYERFLQIAQDALGPSYFVQSQDTDPMYQFGYTKIRKNHTTMIRSWEMDLPDNHGVWIDINPLIYVGGKTDFRIKKALIAFTNVLYLSGEKYQLSKRWIIQQKKWATGLVYTVSRLLPDRQRKRMAKTIRSRLYHAKKKTYYSGVWGSITTKAPVSAFEGEPVYLQFEDDVFPVPPDYDLALKGWYGDYMKLPPEDQRKTDHGELILDYEHSWDELARLQDGSET